MSNGVSARKQTQIVTVVAICALALTALVTVAPVSAIFGPPQGLERDGQSLSLKLARQQCEQSLTTSILKRTGATAEEASQSAEVRCSILLEGAPPTVTLVTPHEI